ncbi:MAG: penicillin-binding protein 1C [Myxococcales bacterium]|nr:penicillin-binding protein 1C [Myxococcales bacterium]MCB9733187.1 penicillin-binding protein 1C [Deltaproteobacteria bacterium]
MKLALAWMVGVGSALVLAFMLWVVAVPFPREALAPGATASTVVVDRGGRLLREVLSDAEGRGRWVPLADIAPDLVLATVQAEDKRFWDHAGVDGVAIARSLGVNAAAGRAVTGASTITQQTVKLTLMADAPRSLGTKVMEAVWALRLELACSKEEILEQYLNRVPYGNQLQGAEAAALMYFGKPAAHLSLAEAAFLAGIPRSPTTLNPYRRLADVVARQREILDTMRERGAITEERWARAVAEPLQLLPRRGELRAPHFGAMVERAVMARAERPRTVATTLDLAVQDDVAAVLARKDGDAAERGGFQAAAVVLDTRTAEVRAWVGSRDFQDAAALGQNDGVLALRQPGSTLKPFVYGTYLDLGGSVADVLADVPTEVPTEDGVYRPQNYDRRFHGPVTMRTALGSSLNVPAVVTAEKVGVERVLATLHRAGFDSLTESPDHYGPGLALGNGEVRLIELAGAYAALGRGGEWRAPRWERGDPEGAPETRRVVSPETAWRLLDMLSDDEARALGFGHDGPLALPYRVAAKTGTSSDFRDNWAVAVTPDYTVAVWVGNFDGRPMNHVSGSVGAAPTVRQILQTLYPRAARPGDVRWFEPPPGLESVTLCRLTGAVAGPLCPGRGREWLTLEERAELDGIGDGWRESALDRQNGLLAGPGCAKAEVERRRTVTLPAIYADWAREAGVPTTPTEASPRCPEVESRAAAPARLLYPLPRDRYFIDPTRPRERQVLTLRAASADGRPVTFFVDGAPVATVSAPYRAEWPLEAGRHEVAVGRDAPEEVAVIHVQ